MKMVANDGFKMTSEVFTMKVNTSFQYGLVLFATYAVPIVTALGVFVYINSIYNIIGKKYYKYPKKFKLEVGQEITTSDIPPFRFIDKNVLDSEFLIAELKKTIAE